MATTNLGQVRDKITRITRTAGDGTAGTIDTYTIYTECSPSGAGTFTVTNGTSSNISKTSFSNLTTSTYPSLVGTIRANIQNVVKANITTVDGDTLDLKVEMGNSNAVNLFFWNGNVVGSSPTVRGDPILLEQSMFGTDEAFEGASANVFIYVD